MDSLENIPYDELTFTSADETIATVDNTGLVTGVKEGETTITIEYKTLNEEGEEVIVLSKDAKISVVGA